MALRQRGRRLEEETKRWWTHMTSQEAAFYLRCPARTGLQSPPRRYYRAKSLPCILRHSHFLSTRKPMFSAQYIAGGLIFLALRRAAKKKPFRRNIIAIRTNKQLKYKREPWVAVNQLHNRRFGFTVNPRKNLILTGILESWNSTYSGKRFAERRRRKRSGVPINQSKFNYSRALRGDRAIPEGS